MKSFIEHIGLFFILLIANTIVSYAEPNVHSLAAVTKGDSVFIKLSVDSPFSQETRETLDSGLPVAIDVQIQFIRTGFVKRNAVRIKILHNVWNNSYAISVNENVVVYNSYRQILSALDSGIWFHIISNEYHIGNKWLIKVRAGERRILKENDDLDIDIGEELGGIAGWLFNRGRKEIEFSDWTPLVKVIENRNLQ